MGKKKKFIDKKNSVTYHLVHRSQKDPLAADEDAPGYVLEPVGRVNKELESELPPSVFASAVEEEVGLLNKAAPLKGPQPDWDPDIVARFDDEFEDENDDALDDDFIVKANAQVEPQANDDNDDEECDSDRDLWEDFDDDDGKSEIKSRFTEYSVTSSVIPRSKGLQLLDGRFETLYEQYDDEEIGALEQDEIVGCLTTESAVFKQIVEDYERQKALERSRQFIEQLEQNRTADDECDGEDFEKFVIEKPTEKWDCESILSKNSTLYNHPQLIKEPRKLKPIRIVKKSGVPKDVLKSKLTSANLKQLDKQSSSISASPPQMHMRKKHEKETPEEKQNRKHAVKEQRRERRIEKKLNKEAFKEEKKMQEKILVNAGNKLQTMKIN